MEMVIETVGWIGMALVVLAYFLVSTKRIEATHPYYPWMNIVGSIGIGVNVFHKQAWPAVTLQVIWALIGLFALFNMRKKKAR